MAVWRRKFTLEQLNERSEGSLSALLGILYIGFDDYSLSASMPVDQRTMQPRGILHGGASAVLAESVGSMAANICVTEDYYCVGLDINANHLRPAKKGETVTARASAVHLGSKTQVWQIEIHNDQGRHICTSRLTMAVLKA